MRQSLKRPTECLQLARLFEFGQTEEIEDSLIRRQHVRFDKLDGFTL